MGAVATLTPSTLAVEPGGEASTEVLVRNTGTVVDLFTVEVRDETGLIADWVTADPPSVSLLPGGEETVRLRIAPPRSPQTPAGPMPFAVRVASSEDPQGSIVEEATLEVGRFSDLSGELLPRTSRGRRSATHEVAVDNRGNGVVNATLAAADADELLEYELTPPSIVAQPGTATFVKVRVRPKKRFMRGVPQTHPFQVLVEPEDEVPLALDGSMLQEPILPRWFFKALLALVMLLILLAVLWQTLLKPTLESAAREAAEEAAAEQAAEQAAAIEEIAEQAAAAEEAAAAAAAGQAAAGEASAEAAEAVAEAEAEAAEATAAAEAASLGRPEDFRLGGSVTQGSTRSFTYTVGQDEIFSLTDIVAQNPRGDRGLMQIRRGTQSTLIEVRLENFRDLDYRFVSPIVFTSGQQVVLTVRCQNEDGSACQPGAYFNGFTRQAPPPPDN
jgi:hypothetical protein